MNLERLTVLHINKFHHVIGGSDVIYFRTAELLEKHGHKSVFFSMKHPLNLPCITSEYFMPFIDLETNCNIGNYLLAACRNFYSFKARKLVSGLLDKYKADMVHIHDLHRQISPSILYEFRKRNIPVVMTLHQYKMICPSYLMFAHDNPCEACDKGKYYSAIKLRCVKGALLRSALVSAEMYLHHKILDVYRNVDVFIAPSLFLKYKHEEMGFKKKSVHLPYPLDIRNFEALDNDVMPLNYDNGLTFTFFGRLVPEKGLFTLIDALKILAEKHQEKNLKVRIIGEGPIKNQLITA
ncbi:MAG: glycosyltransferase [Nitrospirae bacterium]|nr:glycosyltransferase [Nitrospirota bacterium]